jgi:hypothetical protein
MKSLMRLVIALALMMLALGVGWIAGRTGVGAAVDTASLPELERQFAERMQNVALVGRFTIAGREDRQGSPERYDLASVEKIGDDLWRFNARMRYGKVDTTLPVAVTMRWIGDTPMITITDLTIPTLGTFTARVFFYGDQYAGTWQHGKVGGHMFGRIEKGTQATAS